MPHPANSSRFSEFRRAASELRRDREDLDARLERLSRLSAETDRLIAESKGRIARSLALVDAAPSVVPEVQPEPALNDLEQP